MADEQLYDNARKMLKELEDGGIVPVLEQMGVKARIGHGASCAITVYLNETVGGGQWETGIWSASLRGSGQTVELSEAVSKFIGLFDAGCYPQLVADKGAA